HSSCAFNAGSERQTCDSGMHLKPRNGRAGRPLVHSNSIEGGAIEGLTQLIDDILPDLLVVGVRREMGGFSGFIGGIVHHLALHRKIQYSWNSLEATQEETSITSCRIPE
ncbi:MAG TPA: hypothetical protein VE195_05130, partial [Acidobacteriaceae bacterium]|nr:hypothetical protein [Acidobacteriaceae bacterium]